jgi:hypothetical protein
MADDTQPCGAWLMPPADLWNMPRSFLDIERSDYGAPDWLPLITKTSNLSE